MRQLNIYTCLGITLNIIWIISKEFSLLNNNIQGIIVIAGLTLILLGIITKNYDIYELKEKKNKFLNLFSQKNNL